jgi:hypothetical protein
MGSLRKCPSCRALLSEDQLAAFEGKCVYCNVKIPLEADVRHDAADLELDNPYAPPATDLKVRADSPAIPRELGGKITLAGRLFGEQLPLFAALVLTVWVPGNMLLEMATASGPKEADSISALWQRLFVELFFAPLYTAGIITALASRLEGVKISYTDAMRAGLHHWGRLFGARLVATLLNFVGFLCFFIPGVILAIRFMLIDAVVVLEGAGIANSRWRSAMLTRGRGWALFLASAFATGLLVLSGVAIGAVLELAGIQDQPLVLAAYYCLLYVVSAYSICLRFLFYQEARDQEGLRNVIHEGERSIAEMHMPDDSWRFPQ